MTAVTRIFCFGLLWLYCNARVVRCVHFRARPATAAGHQDCCNNDVVVVFYFFILIFPTLLSVCTRYQYAQISGISRLGYLYVYTYVLVFIIIIIYQIYYCFFFFKCFSDVFARRYEILVRLDQRYIQIGLFVCLYIYIRDIFAF